MKNIQLFFEMLESDSKLQEKFKAIPDKGKEEVIDIIIALAKENGFEITKEDILSHLDAIREDAIESGELNEMELDAVAGGGLMNWIAATVMSLGILCAATYAGKVLINRCGLDDDGYDDAKYNP